MSFFRGRRLVLIAVALGACAFKAAALPVHVSLDWRHGLAPSARPVVKILAVQTAGPNRGGASLKAAAGPDGAVLNLSNGVWQLRASAPGYWNQSVEVTVKDQPADDVRLVLWPAASLHGEVVTAAGETLPDSLEVQMSAVTPTEAETRALTNRESVQAGPSRAELHCPIKAGIWTCLAPAGVFDLRIDATGYAPRYEWGQTLRPAESVDTGKGVLLRTASVFGRIIRKDGSNPPAPCRATLRPDMERHGPGEPDEGAESGPDAKTSYPVTFNERGYFQVIGIVPGRYAMSVACQGASGFQSVRVQANTENRVDPPLVLEELTLDVNVTPKADPEGHPWKLAVYQTGPHYLLIAGAAPTSADGRWVRHGLMAGKYHVLVKGSDGAPLLQKYFDLGKNSGPLSLRVGSLSVAGRLTMSLQPVRARLVFDNNVTNVSATLTSDENGRFQGVLPVASSTQASSWTVEAHLVQPQVVQQLLGVIVRPGTGGNAAWLDLDLPAVPVRGSVVSSEGKPQPNVEVVFEDSNGARSTTSTDDSGRFEMRELPPGKYTATAHSYDGSSDHMPFEVGEGTSRELKLVLNPFKRYSFKVVSGQGPVADAAVQVWVAPGVPRAFVRSDDNGRFEVALAPGTREVGLVIGAAGFAIKLTRVPVSDSDDDSTDAHTIKLDTSTGTLVLNLQPPGSIPDDSAAPYLVHNGAIQDARTISGWGTDQAGTNINGPVTVDMIEPGDYALCRVDPAELSLLWTGSLPSDRCRKGSLDQDETLTLSSR